MITQEIFKRGLPIPEKFVKEGKRKDMTPWKEYKKSVWLKTEQIAHLIPGIENRGFKKDHIDHIISIWKGFKMGLPEDTIGGLSNLRMLNYKLNMKKGRS